LISLIIGVLLILLVGVLSNANRFQRKATREKRKSPGRLVLEGGLGAADAAASLLAKAKRNRTARVHRHTRVVHIANGAGHANWWILLASFLLSCILGISLATKYRIRSAENTANRA
jgi:hypothetical protein